jgi:ABC-type glutathione transport system ATPase component
MIDVKRLKIEHEGRTLVDIAFRIEKALALVGQSGSGKSLTLKALLGMLPPSMTCLLDVDAPFTIERGESVAFVPQNPFTALSPLTRVERHFEGVDKAQMTQLLEQVGLEPSLLRRYPPELSGGQLQRVVIAIALSHRPKLLLLDEPTTALDPQTRVIIIDLLRDLQRQMAFSMLFVTHDIVSARALCSEICVIREGAVIEHGEMAAVTVLPQAAYTRTLIEASFANREFRT